MITKAIDSVMNQTYQDFDILIIDDASTDNTAKVVEDLKNEKIRYYKLDKNSGQCVARNYGIRRSTAKYIAFLDSDDVWLPDKLQKQIDCFNNGSDKLGAVYGDSYKTDVIKNITTLAKVTFYRGQIHDKFQEGFCPPTPSLFMVRRDVLNELNGFDEHLLTFVDLDMWLRVSEKYEFDFVEQPIIIKYEQIGDQYINNFEKRYKGYHLFLDKWRDRMKAEQLKILKKHLAYALMTPLLDHPPINLRSNTPKLLALLLKIRSKRYRYYLKVILIMIFGTNIIYFIRKTFNTNRKMINE